jgi:hypothetical protein
MGPQLFLPCARPDSTARSLNRSWDRDRSPEMSEFAPGADNPGSKNWRLRLTRCRYIASRSTAVLLPVAAFPIILAFLTSNGRQRRRDRHRAICRRASKSLASTARNPRSLCCRQISDYNLRHDDGHDT